MGGQQRLRCASFFMEDAFGNKRHTEQACRRSGGKEGLVKAALVQATVGNRHGKYGINLHRMGMQQAAGFVFQHTQRTAVGIKLAAQDGTAHHITKLPAHQQAAVSGRATQAGTADKTGVGDTIGTGGTMDTEMRQACRAIVTQADHCRCAATDAARLQEAAQPAGNHAAAARRVSRILCR